MILVEAGLALRFSPAALKSRRLRSPVPASRPLSFRSRPRAGWPRGAHRDGKPRIGVEDGRLHPIEIAARQEPAPAGERVLPVTASRGGLRRRASQKASGRNTRFPHRAARHPIIGRACVFLTRDKAVLGALDHTSLTRRAANERVDHRLATGVFSNTLFAAAYAGQVSKTWRSN